MKHWTCSGIAIPESSQIVIQLNPLWSYVVVVVVVVVVGGGGGGGGGAAAAAAAAAAGNGGVGGGSNGRSMPMPISILISVCVLSFRTAEREPHKCFCEVTYLGIIRKFVDILPFCLNRTKITIFILILNNLMH